MASQENELMVEYQSSSPSLSATRPDAGVLRDFKVKVVYRRRRQAKSVARLDKMGSCAVST